MAESRRVGGKAGAKSKKKTTSKRRGPKKNPASEPALSKRAPAKKKAATKVGSGKTTAAKKKTVAKQTTATKTVAKQTTAAKVGTAKAKASTSKKKVTTKQKTATKVGSGTTPASRKKATSKRVASGGRSASLSAQDKAASADPSKLASAQSLESPAFPKHLVLEDQSNRAVELSELLGTPFVLYFYPKDDTPGCTKQACSFRDELSSFAEAGVKVVGVSPDSAARHARFTKKYDLNFTLLADTDKALAQAFGVYKLKKNYGREYMGIERSTFVLDAAGTTVMQWRKVRVAGHVPAVLASVRALGN